MKDVALTRERVQEKSCICLENKDIPRATWSASLYSAFLTSLGHDLDGLLCEKILISVCACSSPRLRAEVITLVLATAAAYRGCLSL